MKRALIPLLAAFAAGAALAAIPSAEKLTRAVAETNELAGRAEPLLLDVRLRIAGAGPSADGELATHPTGLARLELRSPTGFVERHLLLGDEYSASRDGRVLDHPHPFLPPVFLLQASSGAALSAALVSFGVFPEEVVWGRMGDRDCYVIGGRRPPGPAGDEELLPSLWVDASSFEPLRVVRADGTEYLLGPTRRFDGIRLPSWIDIRSSDSPPARLEIVGATKADAPAAVFQSEWLTAPAPAERREAPGAAAARGAAAGE